VAIATINRLITLFDGAFKALAAPVCMAESERLAMIVQFAMDSRVRAYHTSAHIFDLVDGMNPHQVLAALFHDLVYFNWTTVSPSPRSKSCAMLFACARAP